MSTTRRTDRADDTSPAARYAASRKRQRTARSPLGQFQEQFDFPWDDFQIRACTAVADGSGVLVAAPTGAGKTVVGEFACYMALETGRKAFYTTPIKALSNQKYADLSRRFGAHRVGLLTGDTSINAEAPVVVMTTEVLRNMLYAGSDAVNGLGFVVMDEVHYLGDRSRGAVWEEVIIHLPDDVQVVSLSATVSNAEEFGDWLAMVRGDTAVIVSEHRPVPLWSHIAVAGAPGRASRVQVLDLYAPDADPFDRSQTPKINPEVLVAFRATPRSVERRGGDRGYRGRGGRRPATTMSRPTPGRTAVVAALDDAGLLPAIYFIFSRAGCDGAVDACMRAGLRLVDDRAERTIERIVDQKVAGLEPADLAACGFAAWRAALMRGIAAHHAGMLPVFKETVEELFTRGLVPVVFATETLALGINMPARSVVMDRLVKWDGTAHVDVTAGEYTQLTGRAGRRGIDVEGHAIVVDHHGLDPMHVAGLASRRSYPLRSTFTPTYNMAVNLIGRVGMDAARDVLETSFAQFQADRGVVGLAKQAKAHAEALDGYATAMTCDRGDFAEYMALRDKVTSAQKATRKAASAARRVEATDVLGRARVGDVLAVTKGRRTGHVVVVEAGGSGYDGPRVKVVGPDARMTTLTTSDAAAGVEIAGRVRTPSGFSARRAVARRDAASRLRAFVDRLDPVPVEGRGRGSDATEEEIASLQRAVRAHPCHRCPDREEHARWARRWREASGEHAALLRRIKGRTGSIAKVFDRRVGVLADLGYVTRPSGAGSGGEVGVRVTAAGRMLARIYTDGDLLLAQALRSGAWVDLDPPALAAMTSTLVYTARTDLGEPRMPGSPAFPGAWDKTVGIWSRLDDLERSRSLEPGREPDLGLAAAVDQWARGRSLGGILGDLEITAGDFVRWVKQVIDILDQIAKATDNTRIRANARTAIDAMRRGVVADQGF